MTENKFVLEASQRFSKNIYLPVIKDKNKLFLIDFFSYAQSTLFKTNQEIIAQENYLIKFN